MLRSLKVLLAVLCGYVGFAFAVVVVTNDVNVYWGLTRYNYIYPMHPSHVMHAAVSTPELAGKVVFATTLLAIAWGLWRHLKKSEAG